MYMTILVIFLLVSIALISMVILQQGKGANMGASLNAGASTALFGSLGSGNFITRITAIFATLFFVISLILGNLTANKSMISSNKWENIGEPIKVEKPEEVGNHTTYVAPTGDIPH